MFLALELTRADCPKLMEQYAREKIAATATLPQPRALSLDDVVALMLAVGEKIRPCDEAGTYILKKEEA